MSLSSTLESHIQNGYVAVRNLTFLVTEVSRTPKALTWHSICLNAAHVEQVPGGGGARGRGVTLKNFSQASATFLGALWDPSLGWDPRKKCLQSPPRVPISKLKPQRMPLLVSPRLPRQKENQPTCPDRSSKRHQWQRSAFQTASPPQSPPPPQQQLQTQQHPEPSKLPQGF